jgi:hypothetical protein
MNIAKFAVIRHYPVAHRSEHVNIGVLVFCGGPQVVVRMGANLRKLKALDPSVDVESVHSQEEAIPALIAQFGAQTEDDIRSIFGMLGPWRLASETGQFGYHDSVSFEDGVRWALGMAVDPVKVQVTPSRQPTSKLFLDLKRTFEAQGWLGRDIERHQIVARYPLLKDEGLTAEFALKNGVFQVVETVDFRSASNIHTKRGEAQAKALVMNMASEVDPDAKTFAVVAGSDMDEAKPTIKLLERIATDIFIYESHHDMDKMFGHISNALHRPQLTPPMDWSALQ